MKKNQILEEAFKLFARQGYESTTMQQIGDAVGLDKSSLYVYFKNKSDIYTENLSREYQVFEHEVVKHLECTVDSMALLRTLFINSLKYFSDCDKLLFWKQVVLLARGSTNAEIAQQSTEYMDKIKTCVHCKLYCSFDDVKNNDMLFCSMILMQGFMGWFLLQKKVDEHDVENAVHMFDNIVSSSKLFN